MVLSNWFTYPFFKNSITFRILISFAILLLVFCFFTSTIAIMHTRENVSKTIQDQQLSFANYVANDIDVELSKSIGFFTNLAGKHLKGVPQGEISEVLKNMHIPPNFKMGVIAIQPDGHGLVAEEPVIPGRKNLTFAGVEWFERAKKSTATIISTPFRNRITKKPSIVFACPIRGDNDGLTGVVAGLVELDQSEFLKHLYDMPVGEKGGFLVISPKDKLFVASNIPEMVLKPTPKVGKNELHDRAMNGHRGVGITFNAFGVEELSAIASIESTGWFVVIRIPSEEAYSSVNQLSRDLAVYFSLLLIGLIVASYIILFTALRPLRKYSREVKEMASGQKKLCKLSISSQDEVGSLIVGFNSLVDTINARTVTLREANEQLNTEIHERRKTENELADLSRELSDIIDFLPDPTWAIDHEGRIIIWNKAVEKLTGVAKEEMIGKGEYAHAIPFYGERRPTLSNLLLEHDGSWLEKYSNYRKTGDNYISGDSFHPMMGDGGIHITATAAALYDSHGNVVGAIQSVRDFTERKKMEEMAFFQQQLFNAIPAPIFYKDRECRYLGCNEHFESFYAVKQQDIIGKTVHEIAPKLLAEEYHAKDLELLDSLGIQLYESKVSKPGGEEKDVIFHKCTFLDLEGNLNGIIGIILDITELRRAESKIKVLSGFLPICASCKKVRDDQGYWNQIESYIQSHSEAEFSHSVCPECMDKLYGDQDWFIKAKRNKQF